MRQTRLFFKTSKSNATAISHRLEEAFSDDGYPFSSFERDEQAGIWEVAIYVPAGQAEQVSGLVADMLAAGGDSPQIERETLPEIDWVTTTLRAMPPIRAGRFMVHGSHDNDAPRAGDIAICIDAGQAFGTGHHGTTAGCLDMIDFLLKRRRFRRILDVGTGSGILAIATAKATTARILASDIDPVSVDVARENARKNNQANRIDFLVAEGFSNRRFNENGPFDLIIANILAGPLQAMARDLVRYTSRHGIVILSGLLPHQQARIVAHYRLQGLHLMRAHLRDGWTTLVFRREKTTGATSKR